MKELFERVVSGERTTRHAGESRGRSAIGRALSREAKGGTRKPRQDTAQRELRKPVLC